MTAGSEFHYELRRDRCIRGTVSIPEEQHWPAPVVVFCHGFKGFKDWGPWPWLAGELAARGFLVNRFNFSMSGIGASLEQYDEPEMFARNTFGVEMDDLSLVLDQGSGAGDGWGVPRNAIGEQRAVIGHSRGGLVALLHAGSDERIDTVVALASPGHEDRYPDDVKNAWRNRGHHEVINARTGDVLHLDVSVLDDFEENRERYDLKSALERREVPTLIIHGDADETIPVAESQWIADGIPHDDVEKIVVEGAGHTFETRHPFDGPPPEMQRVLEHAEAWLRKQLLS